MNIYKVFPFIEAMPLLWHLVSFEILWETLIMNFAYGITASPVLFVAVST